MSAPQSAVLLVHGIQGSPSQLDFLLSALPPGTPYINLLLPGHGGGTARFRKSGREAWERSVRQAAAALGNAHGRVIFVGHSMGCLLGLRAALDAGIRFDAMLFIACPFRLRLSLQSLRRTRKALSRHPGDDPRVLAIRDANSVRAGHPLAYLTCLHPYLELLRLIRDVRRISPKPLLRVTAAFCGEDEIVSARSWREAQDLWRFSPVLLPGCTHHLFTEDAKETLRQILNAMVQGNGPPGSPGG